MNLQFVCIIWESVLVGEIGEMGTRLHSYMFLDTTYIPTYIAY